MFVLLTDVALGVYHGCKRSKTHIVDSYVKIPLGLVIMLMILYGANQAILKIGISFPASVTCMLVLYFALLVSSKVLGTKRTSYIIKYIEIPAGFSLRWINIFFTPAFMTLPNSQRISVSEAFVILAVFVIGYFLATIVIAYFTVVLQRLLKMGRKSNIERAEELHSLKEDGSSTALDDIQLPTSVDKSQEIDLQRIQSNLEMVPDNIIIHMPRGDEDQYDKKYRDDLEKSRRNSMENDLEFSYKNNTIETGHSFQNIRVEIQTDKDHEFHNFSKLQLPSPMAKAARSAKPEVNLQFTSFKKLFCRRSIIEQEVRIERHVQIEEFVLKQFDLLVFGLLFIAGLPIYYAVPYEMFLQLSISIFTFILVLRFPVRPKVKRFLHPVLFSVGLSMLFYYIFAVIKGEPFLQTINNYKTGTNYLNLFDHSDDYKWPGAGDVFSSLLDVSIVALSLPMYTYRHDLWKHMFAMLPPILLMSAGCFFIYPPLCYHIGISAERSLGFAGRSVTLALGSPFVKALNGSIPLMACTTVVSGIVGALTGQTVFRWLRIREDDYVTRGLTLGVNCGAIATAHLLSIDPRAAAISSLSFVLFGTIMVIMSSIPALSDMLQSWVGM